jgi:hypothetical protein
MEQPMTEPSLALQIAVRDRLINVPSLTALVPAERIFDRSTRPTDFPCIIIGDGQTVLEGFCYSVRTVRVFLDLHIWANETGTENAKTIAGLAFDALAEEPIVPGFMVNLFRATGIRTMRDPSGEHSHAVLSVEAMLGEVL